MKNICFMLSVVLALLLTLSLAHGNLVDIADTSGGAAVVDSEVSEAATADTSLADDTTLTEDDSITVDIPDDDGTTSEEATNEEAVDDTDPGDIPINEPNNATPLPSTLVLLGSGLLALSGLAWRRHDKR
jgi:hypothetical protein